MSDQPVPTSTDNQPELFDLAATLAGCAPVDLLKVRRGEGNTLIVILGTGQKFSFPMPDAAELTGELLETVRAQLAPDTGPADPAPAPSKPKSKRAA